MVSCFLFGADGKTGNLMVLFYMPKDFQELYELRLHGTGRAEVLYQFGGGRVNSIDQIFDLLRIYA